MSEKGKGRFRKFANKHENKRPHALGTVQLASALHEWDGEGRPEGTPPPPPSPRAYWNEPGRLMSGGCYGSFNPQAGRRCETPTPSCSSSLDNKYFSKRSTH